MLYASCSGADLELTDEDLRAEVGKSTRENWRQEKGASSSARYYTHALESRLHHPNAVGLIGAIR